MEDDDSIKFSSEDDKFSFVSEDIKEKPKTVEIKFTEIK